MSAAEFKTLLSMIEPIETECLCDFPCLRDDDEFGEGDYDFDNPSDHHQFCPKYFTAYIRAKAEGKPMPI